VKFDVGDTVLLLHSGEEGTITDILDDEMAMVRVNGVVFPVYMDQLDFPYFKRFTAKKTTDQKRPFVSGENLPVEVQAPATRKETGVFLSFLPVYDDSPDDPLVQTFKVHLLNETVLSYHFHYRMLLNGRMEIEIMNLLLPFSHFYLNDFPFDMLNDRPRFEFIFSLQHADAAKAESYQSVIKPKARQVIKQINDLRENQNATFSYLLFEQYPGKARPKEELWNLPDRSSEIKYIDPAQQSASYVPRYEVDLHIEKLIEHPEKLSPADMLMLQLGEFHRQLELAIAHRQFSLVVIHGVGKGKLRDEVHEILRHTPEVKYFVNQYDIRYGYGATEIFFEYK